jgi:GNAT superfamily N-acetyltransferase
MSPSEHAQPLRVVPASSGDFDTVMQLLAEARMWHMQNGLDVWKAFDPALIAADIEAGGIFVARIGDAVCGAVTLTEHDWLVWGMEQKNALYVHRLVSSRQAVGLGIGAAILRWAQDVARQRGKTCRRLETWDTNHKLRTYYEKQGFRHIRDAFFPSDSPVPEDYRGTRKSLYELTL